MRKRINIIIIIVSTIAFVVLYAMGVNNPLILTLLTIPFYLINLIYYRETRLFIAYNFVTIISLVGYFFFVFYVTSFPLNLVIQAMTDIGKFIYFFLMFGIVLQNKIDKKIERILIYLTLFNIVFLSLSIFTVSGFIAGFVSYERLTQLSTLVFLNVVFLVLYFLNAFVKIYVVIVLDRRKTYRINREKIRQEKIKNSFY